MAERGKYKRKENNWKRGDNVFYNSLFGFDYCFCNSDCGNIHCGRNKKSDSYKAMINWIRKFNGCYSCADFTASCRAWRKPKERKPKKKTDNISLFQESDTE